VATSSSFLTVLLVFSKSEANGTNANHGFQALVCKKCQYPLKETKDISVSVRQHKFGRQGAGGHEEYGGGGGSGDGDYEGGGEGYSGFGSYGGGHHGEASDEDEEEEDDEDDDDDEEEEEEDEDEYSGSQSVGMAALNIKEYKNEAVDNTSQKGKSSK
jgi:hypothetical protein